MPEKLATRTSKTAGEEAVGGDPEAEGDEEVDEEEVKQALSRPPPVNSDYLPLPGKGRLSYACLNTYLRNSFRFQLPHLPHRLHPGTPPSS